MRANEVHALSLTPRILYFFTPTEGGCKYHAGKLRGVGWDYKYTCCSRGSRNYDGARAIFGCTKGKHRSKHHTDYPYAAYNFFMIEQASL